MNLSWITSRHFRGLTAKDINSGLCFVWAWIAFQEVKGVQLCTSILPYQVPGSNPSTWEEVSNNSYAHAYVRIGTRFYDSHYPLGTLDHFELMNKVDLPNKFNGRVFTISANRYKRFWGSLRNNELSYQDPKWMNKMRRKFNMEEQ